MNNDVEAITQAGRIGRWILLLTALVTLTIAVAVRGVSHTMIPKQAVVFSGLSEERDSIVSAQAQRFHMDPSLAIAVSHVENWGGDSAVVHPRSGAIGLMQVMPFWADSFTTECGTAPLIDRRSNACRGVLISVMYFQACGDWDCALTRYLGAECRPKDGPLLCARKRKAADDYIHGVMKRLGRDLSRERDAFAFGGWRQ